MPRATVVAVLVLLSGLVGCGPKGPVMHEVHGRVTLSGKAVPGAQVQFVPDQKGTDPASAVCDEDGTYKMMVPAGDHTSAFSRRSRSPPRRGLPAPTVPRSTR